MPHPLPAQASSNYRNTITQLKRLIGRKFSDPVVQADKEVAHLFNIVQLEGDEVGIEVDYDGKPTVFTPQQALAIQLGAISDIVADSNSGAGMKDVVLSVPPFFTQKMRTAVVDAANIAGLRVLRLLNENTASALSYGMFRGAKQQFSDKGSTVLFLDAGHNAFTATVVEFTNTSLKVKGTAYDLQAGGRDIDAALAKHFAAEFGAKVGTDIWGKPKPRMKLLKAAEKAKKTLSPHGVTQASVSVEYLAMEQDYNSKLSIEKFEELASDVADRVAGVVKAALSQAGVPDGAAFDAIELLGGASRPRIVKRAIATALGLPLDEASGHGLLSTQNPDECVARGCALACAQISPAIRVKEFDVTDLLEYPIRISWGDQSVDEEGDTDLAAAGAGGGAAAETTKLLFKRGEGWPVARRRITFKQFGDFTVRAEYVTDEEAGVALPVGQPTSIGDFAISGVAAGEEGKDPPKIRVDFTMDMSGLFNVLRAEMRQEIKAEPAPAPAPAAPEAKEGEGDANAAEGDAKAAEGDAKAAEGETPAATPSADTPEGDAAAAKEGDAKAAPAPAPAPAPAKKKVRCTELKVKVTGGSLGLDEAGLAAAQAAERKMQTVDAAIRATLAKRNELETYVYDMRSALGERLEPFVDSDTRDSLLEQLNAMEDWLYGDGFDAELETYAAKLAALQEVGDPIKRRHVEFEAREPAVEGLLALVEQYRSSVQVVTEANEHLTDTDRDTVRGACSKAEDWLRDLQGKQAGLRLHEEPALKVADIQGRVASLRGECDPIVNKPKPAPTPPPTTEAPAAAAADAAAEGGDKPAGEEGAQATPEGEGAESAPAADAAAEGEGEAAPAPDADGDVSLEK